MKKWFLSLFFEEYEINSKYANLFYYLFIIFILEFVTLILLSLLG